MMGIYARYMDKWERKLATRDTNRVVRPFEWGLDWLGRLDFPALSDQRNSHAREALDCFAGEALGDSDRFFSYCAPADYRLREGHLTFTSPVETPYAENNIVHAQWFPAERSPRRAVLVLPQWNAGEALGSSDRFFSFCAPADYRLREGHLTFTSPVETP